MLTIKLTLWRQLTLQLIFLIGLSGCTRWTFKECPGTFNASWRSLPATIRIDNLSSGESQVLDLAIQDWNQALGREYLKVDSSSANKIMNNGIEFTDGQEGRTTITWIGGEIIGGIIYINPELARDVDLESLYIHELGHFLGLDHIPGTVMDPVLPTLVRRIEIEQKVLDSVKCLYEN